MHPAGVQVTLSQFSGGSFRRRADTIEDTIFFRDGSSKPSQQGVMKNVSGSEIATLGRVAKESPEQVRTLQPGVLYEYGDHWVLELVCDVLQVTNKHAELKMKTTFDGRPVTTATARYRDDSCPTIRLVKSSEVSYIDAWGKTIPVFENPSEFCPPKHTLMPGQFLQLVTIPSRTFSCSCVHHAEMVGFNYLSERTLVLHVSTNDPKLSAKIDGTGS
eukprot:COSAG01_NODE_462_length_16681_cov_4.001206_8_plen_217_part_00